jgi:two-component system sensor kinase FixL
VQIATVLLNLVGNAIDALRKSGLTEKRIEISADHQSAESVRICVTDNGPGIATDIKDRIFQPFATSKPEGMGLGLAISRTLVEAHGGVLELASSKPTRFCFTLPVEYPGEERLTNRHA